MKYFSWFWFGAAALLAVAGCKSKEAVQSGAAPVEAAQVVTAESAQTPVLTVVTGDFHARQSAALAAQIMGRVQQVLVREGDAVRAGQTLIVLDDAAQRASRDQAAAAVKAAEEQQAAAQSSASLAESTYARYKQLEAQKSVSPQEMDEVARRADSARAQYEAARAQTAALRAQQAGARSMLGYTRIVAPFAGVVTARMVDPGAMAAPGVPLLQLDSSGPLELYATVPESLVAAVRKGMRLGFSVDSLAGQRFEGAVAEITPAADPGSHSFLIKIAAPAQSSLRAGMFAHAEIPNGSKLAVLAPRSAIAMRGSLACAYALDANGVAQLRYLTLGAAHGDKVEALSGLSGGDKLVNNPGDRDLAGKRIEVRP